MKLAILKTFVAISLIFTVNLALAKKLERIEKRQAKQAVRIKKGLKSGKINTKEAARIQKGQEKIEKMKSKALSDDGEIGRKEFKKIKKAQKQQSRRIKRSKRR